MSSGVQYSAAFPLVAGLDTTGVSACAVAFRLTGVFNAAEWGPVGGFPTSDHRMVWVDVTSHPQDD